MMDNNYEMRPKTLGLLLLTLTLIGSCTQDRPSEAANDQLFTTLGGNQTGIDFVNRLEETVENNYYQYMYTYIGGGVAAGDLNNDGLPDLYFVSNTNQDKLYLNRGGLRFEDVTASSGIEHTDGFHTGATMVDINQDGFLDIYVVRGGWKEDQFSNLLYINNGDLTFTEQAAEVGLADDNRGIMATFFDYDNDNDLDVYISNTPD
ncbi:MAG: VCBS repeat-containing protein, partial [Bacteroidota bacterium]